MTDDTLAGRLALALGDEPVYHFARRSGVTDSLLRKYLAGSIPGAEKLVQIAQAAGVSLLWLATGEGEMREEARAAKAKRIMDEFREAAGRDTDLANVERDQLIAWLCDWWVTAPVEDRHWLRVEFRRLFPAFAEWEKKQQAAAAATKSTA